MKKKFINLLLVIGILIIFSIPIFAETDIDTYVEGTGKWRVSEEINPIDDTTTIKFILRSDSGKSVYGKSIHLVLRYQSKKTEAYINWNSYLGSKANVLTRIGDEKAISHPWSLSTDSQATFYPLNGINSDDIKKAMDVSDNEGYDAFVEYMKTQEWSVNPMTHCEFSLLLNSLESL